MCTQWLASNDNIYTVTAVVITFTMNCRMIRGIDNAKKYLMGVGLPEWQIDGILELYKLIDSGSPTTNRKKTC